MTDQTTTGTLPITIGDLHTIKHLLITGQTGSGKTTILKSILNSIEQQPQNANCKLVLIDTKDYDFNGFTSKYLITPIITDNHKATGYLNQLDTPDENTIIIIDELADLIAIQPNIQHTLVDLAQNSKIHIIAATRRNDLLLPEFINIFPIKLSFK